jgi:hypothetical protein
VIPNASVVIVDGPNAGKLTTTDSSGNYNFTRLQQSGFTITASANGYIRGAQGVTLTSNQARSFQLLPVPVTISETLTGEVSASDPVQCLGRVLGLPFDLHCWTQSLPIHNAGTVSATLTWNYSPRDGARLGIEVYDPATATIINESSESYPFGTAQLSTNVFAGKNYQWRVMYLSFNGYASTQPVRFTIATTHPN